MKGCSYEEAIKCLVEKYFEAEYYARNKNMDEMIKKKNQLKADIIQFISTEFEMMFKVWRNKKTKKKK